MAIQKAYAMLVQCQECGSVSLHLCTYPNKEIKPWKQACNCINPKYSVLTPDTPIQWFAKMESKAG